jgi:hypothetical protein
VGVPVPFSVVAAENASAWGSVEQQQKKVAAVAKEPRARKKVSGCVFGGSNTNTRMKSAATQRTVDIFVSRLDPDTTDDDVKLCVSDILDKDDVSSNDFCIERLVSKRVELYASQGHFIQRAHWARAQGPLSQGGPQAVDGHVFLQDYVSL